MTTPAARATTRAILLVGHGAPARDTPGAKVARLRTLEGERRRRGTAITDEEQALDVEVRSWPRTTANDPYRAGVLKLATALEAGLPEPKSLVRVAFNEFCAPSIEDAVSELAAAGVTHCTLVPTMLTPGGVHSEVEIPEVIAELRKTHPEVEIHYVWPIPMAALAKFFVELADVRGAR
jgi:sirohydrochlorin cobaltochelatase